MNVVEQGVVGRAQEGNEKPRRERRGLEGQKKTKADMEKQVKRGMRHRGQRV